MCTLVKEQSIITMWTRTQQQHQTSRNSADTAQTLPGLNSKAQITGRTGGVQTVFAGSAIKTRRGRRVQRGQKLAEKSPETDRGHKIRQAGTGTLWQEGTIENLAENWGYMAGKPEKIMREWGAGVLVDVEVEWREMVATHWGQLEEWQVLKWPKQKHAENSEFIDLKYKQKYNKTMTNTCCSINYLNEGGTFFKKASNLHFTSGLSDWNNKMNLKE